jgi:hypothetical protein
MTKILKFFSVITIIFILVVVIPSGSRSNVSISYNYPVSVGNISPSIVYNNSSNFPPLWSTNLNVPKTQAYTNITDIWPATIYCNENQTTFFADSYGDLIISWAEGASRVYVQSPYAIGYTTLTGSTSYAYLGQITSLAAVNLTKTTKTTAYALVNMLTINGAVFNATFSYTYSTKSTSWSGWAEIAKFPGTNWTSITTNLNGAKYGYNQNFTYVNYNGTTYNRDITNWSKFQLVNSNVGCFDVFSAADNATAYYYDSSIVKASEEFMVSSSNSVYVNITNIILFLYLATKTNKIYVSIGTSLWGANILSNQTEYFNISANSKGGYYENISIPKTMLRGGIYYYLNVYSATSTYWVFMDTPPRLNISAVMDYYYTRALYKGNGITFVYYLFDYYKNPKIISTVEFYKPKFSGYSSSWSALAPDGSYGRNMTLYGISWNGTVWQLFSNGWHSYSHLFLNGSRAITLIQGTNWQNSYLFIANLFNRTSTYVSSMIKYNNLTFSPRSSIFSYGTLESLSYDPSVPYIKALETNGTVAYGTTNSWSYVNNLFNFYYKYPTFLAINSTYSQNFTAYASYKSGQLWYMYNFTLYFNDSARILLLEFAYQNGSSPNLAQNPALLNNLKGILINVTMKPNMAFNSKFYFIIYFHPQTTNSIIFGYIFNILIINHFQFIPIR